MQGGIGFGLGHVLFAEVTVEAGRPLQGNFDTYRSLRIDEMPEIEVVIVPSAEKPTGVGEPAFRRLGRRLPMRWPGWGSHARGSCLWCEADADLTPATMAGPSLLPDRGLRRNGGCDLVALIHHVCEDSLRLKSNNARGRFIPRLAIPFSH